MEAVQNILVRVVAEVQSRRRLVASVSAIAIVALLLTVIVRHGGPSQMASGVSRTMSEAKNIVAGTIASGITAIKQQLAKSTSDSEALTKSSTNRRTKRLPRTSKPGGSRATAAAPASDAPGANQVGPSDLPEVTSDLPVAQRALDTSAIVFLVPEGLDADSARGSPAAPVGNSGNRSGRPTAADLAEPRPYTSSDDGVIPPVLRRQQLPTRPPLNLRPEDLGVLELVIDQAGRVESVKLRSPLNRFHDKMIVAAAKAWQFRPALKNGRPVRFRFSVRITLPN